MAKKTQLDKDLSKLDKLMQDMASLAQYNEWLNLRDMLVMEGKTDGSN